MLTVRLILEIDKIHILDSKAIYFVLASPQADLEEYIWMKLPIGFQDDRQTDLKLNKNICRLNKGSFNWYKKLKKLLVERYFKPCAIDPCLYIGIGMILLTYVDNCIVVVPPMLYIDAFV